MSKRLYEVEKIIGRNVFTGKVYYLVKWKGFPSCESTWESVKVLGNVRDMIRDFNQGLKKSI